MTANPMTPFLKLPACAWVFFSLFLWILVFAIDAPEKFPAPIQVKVIFEDPVLIAKKKGTYEIVPLENQQKKGDSLWEIAPTEHEQAKVDWLFGWTENRLYLGIYKKSSKWTYTLSWVQFSDQRGNVKARDVQPEELTRIRPMLIAELNRRFPEGKAGDWFDKVLEKGIEETSYFCVQNVVIALAWVSLVPAGIAVATMLARAKPA